MFLVPAHGKGDHLLAKSGILLKDGFEDVFGKKRTENSHPIWCQLITGMYAKNRVISAKCLIVNAPKLHGTFRWENLSKQGAVATCKFPTKGAVSVIFSSSFALNLSISVQSHRQLHQTSKMKSPKPSIMDESPNLEWFSRDMSLVAVAALAVHVLWRPASPGDHFLDWLVSAMPNILTGFFLFGLLFFGTDTHFFTVVETSTPRKHAGLRTSSRPDREDRHFFNVRVINFAASIGISTDLIYAWYRVCQSIWDDCAKSAPVELLVLVTLSTVLLGMLLFVTWLPVVLLLDKKQPWGSERRTESSVDGDGDPSPRLQTLIAAVEAYGKNLGSQRHPSIDKMETINSILVILRKW